MSDNIEKQLVTQQRAASSRGSTTATSRPRAMANRPTAPVGKRKASFSGKQGTFNPFGKSEDGVGCIICPGCGSGISKSFAVKALAMLAKSEGYELGDELEALAGDGLYEEEQLDTETADKAVSGPTNYVGNKVASHKGKAPGKGQLVGKYRAGGKKGVDRAGKPTNSVTEGGMKKSLFPVIEGDAQIVDYGFGDDSFVAKGIEEGDLHVPPARNLRFEQGQAEQGDE